MAMAERDYETEGPKPPTKLFFRTIVWNVGKSGIKITETTVDAAFKRAGRTLPPEYIQAGLREMVDAQLLDVSEERGIPVYKPHGRGIAQEDLRR